MDIFAVGTVLDTLHNKNINYFINGTNAYIQLIDIYTFEEIFGKIIESVYIKMPIHEAKIRAEEMVKFISNYTINSTSTLNIPYSIVIKFKNTNYVTFNNSQFSISKLNIATGYY